jgi:hypothetical protein
LVVLDFAEVDFEEVAAGMVVATAE